MLEEEVNVVTADIVYDLPGQPMLIGHHGQGDPFGAEFLVDFHAGAFGEIFHAVFVSEALADIGHV